MLKKLLYLLAGLAALCGGICWIWAGGEISVLPQGNPGAGYYRNSHPFMPWLGCGLACVGIGLAGMYSSIAAKAGRFARWSFMITLLGSFVYLFGTLSRRTMNLGVEYEATQPIGNIMAIVGLLVFSGVMLKSKLFPLWSRVLLLVSAVSLLLFNDQFITSWSSLSFGASWIGLSVYLFLKGTRVDRVSVMSS